MIKSEGEVLKAYQVTTGIYKGHSFKGHPIIICGEKRIWDADSVGNSYPAINCIEVKSLSEAEINAIN